MRNLWTVGGRGDTCGQRAEGETPVDRDCLVTCCFGLVAIAAAVLSVTIAAAATVLEAVPVVTIAAAAAATVIVVGWLLNVPATCECVSETDLLRQLYVLPH